MSTAGLICRPFAFPGTIQTSISIDTGYGLIEMLGRLIELLRRDRTVELQVDYMEETASEYHPHRYSFLGIDIILLEGIFIFKGRFVEIFDLRI